MEADVARFENNATIQYGREGLPTTLDVLVPELDVTAPLFVPHRIEVHQQVQAPVELSALEEIKVYMHIEPAARSGDVHSATIKFLISEEVRDTGHICEIGKESRGCERLV